MSLRNQLEANRAAAEGAGLTDQVKLIDERIARLDSGKDVESVPEQLVVADPGAAEAQITAVNEANAKAAEVGNAAARAAIAVDEPPKAKPKTTRKTTAKKGK
jgi:hypothetical protein